MELTKLIAELVNNEIEITKSVNFGNGRATKKQIAKNESIIKKLKKFGFDENIYSGSF